MKLSDRLQKWLETGEGLDRDEARIVTLIASGCATEQQQRDAGELALEVKRGSIFQLRSSSVGPILEGMDERGHVIPWVLSDESRDRMGDRISADGWDTRNFERNPVLLWSHDHKGEPVGRVENLRVENVARDATAVRSLVGDLRFAVDESEQAARLFRLASKKFLNTTSVGFLPKEGGVVVPKNDAERQAMDLGPQGVLFREQELLEDSLVSIPANPNALQNGIDRGIIDKDDAGFLMDTPMVERQLASLVRDRTRDALHIPEPKIVKPDLLLEELRGMRSDLRELIAAVRQNNATLHSPEVQSSEAADEAVRAFLEEWTVSED